MSLPSATSELSPVRKAQPITLVDSHGHRTEVVTYEEVLTGSDRLTTCVRASTSGSVIRTHLYSSAAEKYDQLTGMAKLRLPPNLLPHELGAHFTTYVLRQSKQNRPLQVCFYFTNRKGEIVDLTEYPVTGLEQFGTVE